MKLKDSREHYKFYSGKSSDIIRYLAFVGFPIIWIFKDGEMEGIIPNKLHWFAILLTLTLIFDLIQYLAGALVWGVFNNQQEYKTKLNEKKEFTAPHWINRFTLIPFWIKIATIILAYYVLLKFLIIK